MASVQGWGRETWGSGAWSAYAPLAVTGNGLTSSTTTPTVVTDQIISVTGLGTTLSIGDATAVGIANADPTGEELTSTVGDYTINTDHIFAITGVGATSSLGDTTESVEIRTGWNRDTDITTGAAIGWGDQQWGASGGSFAVSGNSLTISQGEETITTDQNISVTGTSLTSSIGTFAIAADGNITISPASEHQLTASVNDVDAAAEWVVYATGNSLTLSEGDVGTSVFVTGNSLTLSQGDATQETSYEAPSVEATSSVGTLNIVINVDFTLTGVSVTSSTGTLRGTFWSEVDDSQTAVWVEVDKAA